jgi:MoCo/4Fe-4S cofactor protein with predicted Tat translocation signal
MTLLPDSDFDLGEAREQLARQDGPRMWKSLEQLSGAEGFQTWLARAFPEQAHAWPAARTRLPIRR